jgi:LysR family transcriptional regulator, glycine cleavage system transcriptional activator
MYEAAASGAGVALAVPLVSEPWLRAGKLVPCNSRSLPLGETYRLYRPIRRIARTELEHRFADWLHDEVGRSMVEFRTLVDRPSPRRTSADPLNR